MVVFPNCKINLGLNITAKRADGFHNLETVFVPVQVNDALEILPQPEFSFRQTGITVDGDPEQNLVVKAYRLLQQECPGKIPSCYLHLHKVIPMGAGLGGGSADASFTLLTLNQLFDLKIPHNRLVTLATQLGSDCPFFIKNKPVWATGRGEVMQEIALDLSAYQIILVCPGIHIPTPWAFKQITPQQPQNAILDIIAEPVENWKHKLVNDFEAPVFEAHPALARCKADLYAQGAVYAAMSGSGSSVFGLFPKHKKADILVDAGWKIFKA